MKKSYLFWILLAVLALLIISTLIYNFFYFDSFPKKIRPANESEKQAVIKILNEKKGYEESQINIGNVLPLENRNIVQVEVRINGSKERYIVDTINERVLRK